MESFIVQLEDLIEASEDTTTAEIIAALEIIKQSLILSYLTDEEDNAEA